MNIGIAEKISTTMRARLSLTLLLQKMKQSHSHCPRRPPIRKDHLFARVGYKNTPTKTFHKTRQHKPTRTASSRRHESSQDCRGLPAMRHPNRNTFHCHSSLACRASMAQHGGKCARSGIVVQCCRECRAIYFNFYSFVHSRNVIIFFIVVGRNLRRIFVPLLRLVRARKENRRHDDQQYRFYQSFHKQTLTKIHPTKSNSPSAP